MVYCYGANQIMLTNLLNYKREPYISTISFTRPIAHTEPLFKTFICFKFNDTYKRK